MIVAELEMHLWFLFQVFPNRLTTGTGTTAENFLVSQLRFTCSNSTIETIERGVKYVQN